MRSEFIRVSKEIHKTSESEGYTLYSIYANDETLCEIDEDQLKVIYQKIGEFLEPISEVHPVPNSTPSLKTKSEKENYTKNLNRADSIVSSFLPEWIDYATYQADEYDLAVDARAIIKSFDLLNTDAGKGLIEAIEQMRLFALSAIKDKIEKEAIELITTKE